MRVVVTGSTGLIGRALVKALQERGDDAVALSRDVPRGAMAGADAVVHLAGEPVAARRWSEAQKARILGSRRDGTARIVEAIAAESPRPRVLVCASAVGFYGDRGDEPVDEDSPPGHDFLAGVCRAWEEGAAAVEKHGLRRVSLRFGVVLARDGGALAKMLPLFRAGLGGRIGDGRQFFPWVHLDDAVGLVLHALDDERVRGAVNVVAPELLTQAAFARELGRAVRRPALVPTPALAMRLALGEMAHMLLTGQRATPMRALATGYRFRFPDVRSALLAAT